MLKTTTSSLRRGIIVLALTLAVSCLAVAATRFSVDVAEYGLVTRFGRVVRVIVEPGFHVTAPFDRVVRLDKRILFSRPARSEYLTADKKNVVVETLATWRIADPERFLAAFATRQGVRKGSRHHEGSAISGSMEKILPKAQLYIIDSDRGRVPLHLKVTGP